MGLEVRIEGAATLHKVAAQIRAEGRRDLSREMGTALSKAADPVKISIRAEAEETMPDEGGYSALFSKSLRFRLQRRNGAQTARLDLITYADGQGERRDILALERGRLRHPVYGRGRRLKNGSHKSNPWAVTSIRPGFHDRGTQHAVAEAQKQMAEVVDQYAKRLVE